MVSIIRGVVSLRGMVGRADGKDPHRRLWAAASGWRTMV